MTCEICGKPEVTHSKSTWVNNDYLRVDYFCSDDAPEDAEKIEEDEEIILTIEVEGGALTDVVLEIDGVVVTPTEIRLRDQDRNTEAGEPSTHFEVVEF